MWLAFPGVSTMVKPPSVSSVAARSGSTRVEPPLVVGAGGPGVRGGGGALGAAASGAVESGGAGTTKVAQRRENAHRSGNTRDYFCDGRVDRRSGVRTTTSVA